VYACMSDLL